MMRSVSIRCLPRRIFFTNDPMLSYRNVRNNDQDFIMGRKGAEPLLLLKSGRVYLVIMR